jgi:hypothetical protein
MKFNFQVVILISILVGGFYLWVKKAQEKDFEVYYSHLDDATGAAASAIDSREKRDKHRIKNILIVGLALLVWQGIWIPTHEYRTEQVQSKNQYDAYLSGYENGWDDQCSAIFSRLGGTGRAAIGSGISITYPQCLSLKLNTAAADSFKDKIGVYLKSSSVYEIRESGRNHANRAALIKLFSISPYWCYGVECISEKDFGIFRSN